MKFARLLLAFLLAMGTTDAAQLTTSQRVSSRAKSERRGSSDTRSSCSNNRGYIARRLLITSTRKASSKTSMFDIYDKLVMSTP